MVGHSSIYIKRRWGSSRFLPNNREASKGVSSILLPMPSMPILYISNAPLSAMPFIIRQAVFNTISIVREGSYNNTIGNIYMDNQ